MRPNEKARHDITTRGRMKNKQLLTPDDIFNDQTPEVRAFAEALLRLIHDTIDGMTERACADWQAVGKQIRFIDIHTVKAIPVEPLQVLLLQAAALHAR